MSAISRSLRSLKVPSLGSFFQRKVPQVPVPETQATGLPDTGYAVAAGKRRATIDELLENAFKPSGPRHRLRGIRVHAPPPSARTTCKEPLRTLTAAYIARLDPSGARTKLFAPDNPDKVAPGDILLVRQRSGDPFAGVVLSIKARGTDTAVLLRGQLTRVAVEMWFKVYSPNVVGMEVVRRAERRARRARLTYLRKPEHDRGSVEGVVRQYLKQRAALGSASASAALKRGKK